MLQIPDISPYLKGGAIGFLLLVIATLIGIIGFLIKNGFPMSKQGGPPRELSAGEKSPDYWEKVFEDIETEGNRALLQVLTEHHRGIMEMLGKLRARLRDSDNAAALQEVRDFRAKYDQDMVAIAKMLRSIELKLEQ